MGPAARAAVGAVVNPFAPDLQRELRLLERKLAAGVDFLQSQMVFDLDALERFFAAASDLLAGVRFYAGVGVLRTPRMADNVRRLPGCVLPRRPTRGSGRAEGVDLASSLPRNSQQCRESMPCTSIRSARKWKRATWLRRSNARGAPAPTAAVDELTAALREERPRGSLRTYGGAGRDSKCSGI